MTWQPSGRGSIDWESGDGASRVRYASLHLAHQLRLVLLLLPHRKTLQHHTITSPPPCSITATTTAIVLISERPPKPKPQSSLPPAYHLDPAYPSSHLPTPRVPRLSSSPSPHHPSQDFAPKFPLILRRTTAPDSSPLLFRSKRSPVLLHFSGILINFRYAKPPETIRQEGRK